MNRKPVNQILTIRAKSATATGVRKNTALTVTAFTKINHDHLGNEIPRAYVKIHDAANKFTYSLSWSNAMKLQIELQRALVANDRNS